MSEKRSLEEQSTRLERTQTGWLEPMKQWIQEASGLCNLAKYDDLVAKKSKLREIFGSNLIFSNKQKGTALPPRISEIPLGKQLDGPAGRPSKSSQKGRKFDSGG